MRGRSASKGRCGDVVRLVLGSSPSHKLHEIYQDVDIFLDFENCIPKESELNLFQNLELLVDYAQRVIIDLSVYGVGASESIRNALQNPNDAEVQNRSFEAVSAKAHRLDNYFELSTKIREILPELLFVLCSGPLSPAEQIDSAQALCKQFARLVDFIFRFDSIKMATPAIQNDFSFYRRMLSIGEYTFENEDQMLSLERANDISMFLANATPMLNVLVNTTNKFVHNHPDIPVSTTTETLVAVVYICRRMLECKEFSERLSLEDRVFFLRVMTGCLILFDHIDPEGAFSRHSSIDLRAIVDVVKNCGEKETDQLMNALRYTTKHFKDQETPKSIRSLFN